MTPSETSMVRRLRFQTDPKLRRRYMVVDEPVRANLRVGLVLENLDKLAEEVALRFVRQATADARVVTAAIDEVLVHHAPEVNDDLVLKARINAVHRTSLEVGIRIEQRREQPVHIASCYFTMAARSTAADGEDQGLLVPALDLRTPQDRRRASHALERKSRRANRPVREMPTVEEFDRLEVLHRKQDLHGASLPLAGNTVTQGWERTYPEFENVPKTIFGGYVAHRAYMYAHICAEMFVMNRPLLVSINRINFYQPVRMGDKLHFLSRVTYSGDTSLTVETEITRISRDRKMTALSNTCIFTFVNVDKDLHPASVPTVHPTTYAEDARYLLGLRRHELYRASRESKRELTPTRKRSHTSAADVAETPKE